MSQDPNLPGGVTDQMVNEAGDPGRLTCAECGRVGEAEDFEKCSECDKDYCSDCIYCGICRDCDFALYPEG